MEELRVTRSAPLLHEDGTGALGLWTADGGAYAFALDRADIEAMRRHLDAIERHLPDATTPAQ
jgi:hypothetical protein